MVTFPGFVTGRETQELDESTDPGRLGGGGVRDGGFAFAFGDAASRGESASKTRFLRTVGQVEEYLKEQASLIEKYGHDLITSDLGVVDLNAERIHLLCQVSSHYEHPVKKYICATLGSVYVRHSILFIFYFVTVFLVLIDVVLVAVEFERSPYFPFQLHYTGK